MSIIIVAAIILLLVIGLYTLLKIRGNFAEELRNLGELENQIKTSTNARNFYHHLKNSNILPLESLVFERVQIVFNSIDKKISLNLSDISELTISKKEESYKTQFSNFILSTLLIIGLGGTFLAFREILVGSDLGSNFSKENIDAATTKIYKGFDGAFWASICGVFGTVILLFVKFVIVTPKQEKFYNRLDFVTQSELIPLFSALHKNSEQILSEIAIKIEALIGSLTPTSENLRKSSEKASDIITDLGKFSDELKLATEKFSNFTGPSSPFLKAIDKLFDAVKDSEFRYSEYKDIFVKLTDLLQSQNERLSETQIKFVELHNLFESIHDQLRINFEKINTNYSNEIKIMGATFGNEVKTIAQNIQTMIERSENLFKDFSKVQIEHTNSLNEKTETLYKSIENMKSNVENASTKLDKLSIIDEMNHSLNILSGVNYDKELKFLSQSVDNIYTAFKTIDMQSNGKQISQTNIENIQKALDSIENTLKNKNSI